MSALIYSPGYSSPRSSPSSVFSSPKVGQRRYLLKLGRLESPIGPCHVANIDGARPITARKVHITAVPARQRAVLPDPVGFVTHLGCPCSPESPASPLSSLGFRTPEKLTETGLGETNWRDCFPHCPPTPYPGKLSPHRSRTGGDRS